MSIFGKILAFLNILGMVFLFFMALMTYSRREAWMYANYRHDVALRGIALNREERDAQGNLVYLDMPKQMQKELFPTEPVATQKEEVERVRKKLQKKVDDAGDPQKQSVVYATILLPLARTNAQREDLLSIRTHLADDNAVDKLKAEFKEAYVGAVKDNKAAQQAMKDNPAVKEKKVEWAFTQRLNDLRGEPRRPFVNAFLGIMKAAPDKELDAAFDETLAVIHKQVKDEFDREFNFVLNTPAAQMTDAERREAVSRLLFNLIESDRATDPAGDPKEAKPQAEVYVDPTYKRYLAVVGYEQAARTVNRQARLLAEIASDLDYELGRDRAAFALALTQVVEQAKHSARHAEKLKDDVDREKRLVADQQVLVNQRKMNVDAAEKELNEYRDATEKKLKELRQMSDDVFRIRVAVRDATVLNQEHERTIRQLEGQRWLPFVGNLFLLNREER
jgi:hypothetical protein